MWVIDSEKEKVMQRNGREPLERKSKRQKPREPDRNRNGALHGAGGEGPPECWTCRCEDPLSPQGRHSGAEGSWASTYQGHAGPHPQKLQ